MAACLFVVLCALFTVSYSSDVNFVSKWWQTIKNETDLIDQMIDIAENIKEIAHNQSTYNITINSRFVQTIKLMPYYPLRIGYKLMLLMNIWYNYEIHKHAPVGSVQYVRIINSFRINAHKIPNLLHYLSNTPMNHEINKKSFRELKHLLDQIFGDDVNNETTDFDIFYEWLYYDAYIAFISKHKLALMHKLSDGVQANVFLVKDRLTKNEYALKIFNKFEHESAMREENILLRIEAEIHSKNENLSAQLHVPRIISDYKICAAKHSAILLEYIECVPFDNNKYFGQKRVRLMREQIGKSIEILSSFGIGHFDIQRNNILLDVDGYFWLIDFGLSMNLDSEWNIKHIATPLIGTWLFYSPFAFELSQFLDKCKEQKLEIVPDEYRCVVLEHIKKADLYSLEAMILFYGHSNHVNCNGEFGKIHQRCQELWENKNKSGPGINDEMLEKLDEIWTRRQWMVQSLLMQKKINAEAAILLYDRE